MSYYWELQQRSIKRRYWTQSFIMLCSWSDLWLRCGSACSSSTRWQVWWHWWQYGQIWSLNGLSREYRWESERAIVKLKYKIDTTTWEHNNGNTKDRIFGFLILRTTVHCASAREQWSENTIPVIETVMYKLPRASAANSGARQEH